MGEPRLSQHRIWHLEGIANREIRALKLRLYYHRSRALWSGGLKTRRRHAALVKEVQARIHALQVKFVRRVGFP